jgi:hypothetical protein
LWAKLPVEPHGPAYTAGLQLTRIVPAEALAQFHAGPVSILSLQANLKEELFMKSKTPTSAVRALSLLLLVSATCALAQDRRPVHFSGVFNDYSPANPNISGSPYEMHGQWSMDLHERGTADFLADMTMSDYGTTNGVLDATKGGQGAHTHHIRLTNVSVTWSILGCPQYGINPVTMGFQVNGTVSLVTGNGSAAPFDPTTPPTSTLQVCVTGGTELPYSNLTMVFGGPAAIKHFGMQPIHGVVNKPVLDSVGKDR